MKKSIPLALTLLIVISFPCFSANVSTSQKRFSLSFAKNDKVCGDIVDMLNDPLNTNYLKITNGGDPKPHQGTEFIIPDRFKESYLRPEWKPLPEDQFSYKFYPSEYVDAINEYKKKTGIYDVEQATFNYNGERKWTGDETIVRAHYYDKTMPWKCFAGLNNSQGEGQRLNGSPYQDGCSFLITKPTGYNFQLSLINHGKGTISVVEPLLSYKIDDEGYQYSLLTFRKTCVINLAPQTDWK